MGAAAPSTPKQEEKIMQHSFTWADLKSLVNLLPEESLREQVFVIDLNRLEEVRACGFDVADWDSKIPRLQVRENWE
tara:strand:- start:3 stop:233 length:231 start_codon:yes stop_codon:yes gene_type:complete